MEKVIITKNREISMKSTAIKQAGLLKNFNLKKKQSNIQRITSIINM